MHKGWAMLLLAGLAGCSGSKVEAPQLALQPISYFDVTQHKLYGSGCNFVPAGGGMGALFMAMETRGLIKVDDHLVDMPTAPDAAALPNGAHTHYAAPLYAASLTPLAGGRHKHLGVVSVFDAHLVISDARGQSVYAADGEVQCKPM